MDPDITVWFPVRQIPLCFFFFETGSPANSLSTKNVFLSTCSCHRNRIAALGLPTRYGAPRFSGNTRILAVHSPSGPNVLRFPRGRICLLPNRKASRTKICIVLHLPSSEFDSCFGPTPTCLVVSLGVYSLSWCSRCIQILCDEECVSQVRFSMSKNCSV